MTPQISRSTCLQYDENHVPYIDLGNLVIRLEKEDPPKEMLEKAKLELRETPEIKEAAIKQLKLLLQKEADLHLPTDDDYLLLVLRPCKFYPESAMKRVKNYFNLMLKHEELFTDIYPSKLRHVFEEDILKFFPKRDQHGRRILLVEAGKKWKPSKCSLADLFKTIQISVLASMVEPMSQINGAVVILDVEGLPLSHIMQFTPSFAALLLEWVQDCILVRLKAVHIVNNSYIFNMLFAIFKPFIREKLRKRIFFHGKELTSLTTHIDKDVLPIKYGGSLDIDFPPGYLLADLCECYKKDFEMATSFGFTKGNLH